MEWCDFTLFHFVTAAVLFYHLQASEEGKSVIAEFDEYLNVKYD